MPLGRDGGGEHLGGAAHGEVGDLPHAFVLRTGQLESERESVAESLPDPMGGAVDAIQHAGWPRVHVLNGVPYLLC